MTARTASKVENHRILHAIVFVMHDKMGQNRTGRDRKRQDRSSTSEQHNQLILIIGLHCRIGKDGQSADTPNVLFCSVLFCSVPTGKCYQGTVL
jgi:hypothetical protein